MKQRSCRAIGLIILSLLMLQGCTDDNQPELQPIGQAIASPYLNKPTDLKRFQGYYVATELINNRLAFFQDLKFDKPQYFDPASIGKQFSSPHFLANLADRQLLISNGWGNSIVSISSLTGNDWQEFKGDKRGFNAPHGICVDEAGWIYVGDSLNSRLVRFRDMKGTGWEVFKDHQKLVAYARQIVCKDNAVWISNSYENRPGLNPGSGSNVLKIDDFSSGKADIVYKADDTNITGITPIGNKIIVGRWREKSYIAVNMRNGEVTDTSNVDGSLGIPYGVYLDEVNKQIIGAYFGDFERNAGGIAKLFSIK